MMKNKKGFAFTTVIIIVIGLVLLGIFFGGLTAYKVTQTIKSIPKPVWIGLIIFVVLLMVKKK